MMQDWLAAQAAATPNGTALVFQGRSWSFAELNSEVAEYCSRLAGLGLSAGSRAAVHLPNSPAYVGLIFALARSGLTLVALNTRLSIAELSAQVEQAQVSLVISDQSEIANTLSQPPQRLALHLEEFLELPAKPFQPLPLDLQALQGIIFTSGTGGNPKGAMLTFGNHFWNAVGSTARLGMLPQDRWLNPLPLYHVGGLAALFRCCIFGATYLLPESFDSQAVLEQTIYDQATLVSVVPTMLYRMLQQADWKAPDVRAVLLGGAAASGELLQECIAQKLPVALTYGLTESASQVATMPPQGVIGKPGSVGRALLNTKLRIANKEDQALPLGEAGEICVAGPTVMAGYVDDQQATEKTLRNGRLHTGDIGYLDDQGDLWVLARRNDLIVSGGENIYPAEVEQILRQHPAVKDVCVVGLLDVEWGQKVAALVAVQAGSQVDESELLEFSRARLARYKQPRWLRFVEYLPLTASGKVDRRRVREMLLEEF
jgi:O-succinylbenzoic acid--CoA ligase